jgi:hypothetical protein
LPDDSPGVARDWIKQSILDNGPVYTSIYSGFTQFQTYWGQSYGMFTGPASTDHAIMIVGWDDGMPYYTSYPGTPAGYGCWIIKNSWGTSWGQSGFGYVGYGAANCGTNNSYISSYGDCTYDYGSILRYDEGFHGIFLGVVGEYTVYAANRYNSTSSEDIHAVGIWLPITEANYSISIYDDGTPSTNTWTGLLATKSGSLLEGGYHMIELDSAVPIPVDDDFWVQVQIVDPNTSSYYLIAADSTSPVETATCYISIDGSYWQDAGSWDVGVHVQLGAADPTPVPDTPTPSKTPLGWSGIVEWQLYR